MEASSITFCASSQRKAATKIRASTLVLGALALAACSGGKGDGDEGPAGTPSSIFPNLAAAETAEDAKPFRKFFARDLDFGDSQTPASRVLNASPQDVQDFIDADQIRLIDVRTPEEFAQGHLDGAELIPMDRFDPEAIAVSDERTIILYCRSGRRSRVVGEKLAAHNGEPAIHLQGGIIAWQAAGYPIVTPD